MCCWLQNVTGRRVLSPVIVSRRPLAYPMYTSSFRSSDSLQVTAYIAARCISAMMPIICFRFVFGTHLRGRLLNTGLNLLVDGIPSLVTGIFTDD